MSTDGKQTVPEMLLTALTYVTIREMQENRKLYVTSGGRNTASNVGANNGTSPNTYRNNTNIKKGPNGTGGHLRNLDLFIFGKTLATRAM